MLLKAVGRYPPIMASSYQPRDVSMAGLIRLYSVSASSCKIFSVPANAESMANDDWRKTLVKMTYEDRKGFRASK